MSKVPFTSKQSFSSQQPETLLSGNKEVRSPKHKYQLKKISEYSLFKGNQYTYSTKQHSNIMFNYTPSELNILSASARARTSCGSSLSYDSPGVTFSLSKDSKIKHSGTKSCKSMLCPVCAPALSAKASSKLSKTLKSGRENNRTYLMSVLTIPHEPGESVATNIKYLQSMSTYIFKSKPWRKFRALTNLQFVHYGYETMVSFKHDGIDHHPHKNMILDFNMPMAKILKALGFTDALQLRMHLSTLMTKLAQQYLDTKTNTFKELLIPYTLPGATDSRPTIIKGGVSVSSDFNDTYASKWGTEAEMTAGIYKNGKFSKSMHPLALLHLIDQDNSEVTEQHKLYCVEAYQQSTIALKGLSLFQLGNNAQFYYEENYNTDYTDEEPEEEEQTIFISATEWLTFNCTTDKLIHIYGLSTLIEINNYIFDEIQIQQQLRQQLMPPSLRVAQTMPNR